MAAGAPGGQAKSLSVACAPVVRARRETCCQKVSRARCSCYSSLAIALRIDKIGKRAIGSMASTSATQRLHAACCSARVLTTLRTATASQSRSALPHAFRTRHAHAVAFGIDT